MKQATLTMKPPAPTALHSRPTARRAAVITVLAIIAIAAGILLTATGLNRNPASTPAGPSVSSQPNTKSHMRISTAAGPDLAFAWQEGDLFTYEVEHRTTIRVEDGQWGLDTGGSDSRISGRCSFRVLQLTPERVVLASQMSESRAVSDGQTQPHLENLLDSAAIQLVLDPRGRQLDCLFPPELSPEDCNLLAGLHEHQLVLPEIPDARTWNSTEQGNAGSFHCAYTRSRRGTIEKVRRSTPPAADEPESLRCTVEQSTITIAPGERWIELIDARERFAITSGPQRVASVESSFRMRLLEAPAEPAALASLYDDPAAAANFAPRPEGGLLQSTDRSALGRQRRDLLEERFRRVPLAEIVAGLRDATERADRHADTLPAMHALRDWLLVHPAEALAVVDELRDPNLTPAFTARAIHALELSAENHASQEALALILNNPDDFSRQVVMQAIIASGGVGEALIPELHVALSEAVNRGNRTADFSPGDAALYALGSLASTNPEVADQLRGALLPDLDPANDERTIGTALNALANSGVSSPDIQHHANFLAQRHAMPEVRAAAVQYLASLPATTPAELLGYLRDPSGDVQLEAVEALALRQPAHPELLASLEAHLRTSPPESVASRLREILAP